MTLPLAPMPGAAPTGARDALPAATGDGGGFARAMARHEPVSRQEPRLRDTAVRERPRHAAPHEPTARHVPMSDAAPEQPGKAREASCRDAEHSERAQAAEDTRDARGEAQASTGDGETCTDTPPREDGASPREDTNVPACEAPIDSAAADRMLALLTGLAAPAASAATATAPALPTPASAAAALPGLATVAAAGPTGALAAQLPQAAREPGTAVAAAPASAAATLATGVFADALREAETGATSGDTAPNALLSLTGAASTQAAAPRAPAVLDAVAMPAAPADGFDDAFGARIAWMAEQKLGHAELRVTPDAAGPIDIRLQVDGTRIRAEFNALQADTRAALEASIPRLRDMLGQHGLELAHAGVGQQRPGQGDARHTGMPGPFADGPDVEPLVSPSQLVRSRGLLDEYA